MRRFLLAGLLCAIQLCADTYPRQPGIDARHYIFKLALSDDTDEIAGDATVEFRFVQDGVTEIALDLAAPMTVSEVTSGGAPVKFTHPADRLILTLPAVPDAGELRQFHIRYHGIPKDGLRIGVNKYGERTFFSQNWPNLARQWLPMIDHPYDKATSEFIITAPAKYQVVANGLLIEKTDLGDGRRLTHWKQSVPIASWLNAVGVAQFAVRNFDKTHGIRLETWVYHQDRDAGNRHLRRSGAAGDGVLHRSHRAVRLREASQCGGRGPQRRHRARQRDLLRREIGVPATNLVAHEIAHQWFGDSVTEKDWDDVWLSEGFATYFTLLCTEHYEGRDAFVAGLKHSREVVFTTEKKNPGVAVRHDNLSDMKKVLNQLVYQKGGWTLHMLRGQIGTDKFLGRHARLLSPLSRWQRVHGGLSEGDGGELRRGSGMVLRPVAESRGIAGGGRHVAVRCGREENCHQPGAEANGRCVSLAARSRHCRPRGKDRDDA